MFCACGCGKITNRLKRNRATYSKGDFFTYIHGHNRKGQHHNEDSIERMKKVQKGKKSDRPGTFKKGHDVSIEVREKLSKKNKGKQSPNKGKHLSDEQKRKISETNKERGIRPIVINRAKGDRHGMWKGGITDINKKFRRTEEYKQWRNLIYKRDHWRCQKCGIKEKIVAHHIKSFTEYPDLRHDPDNGITLCRYCHLKLHAPTRYGDNPGVHISIERAATEADKMAEVCRTADSLL